MNMVERLVCRLNDCSLTEQELALTREKLSGAIAALRKCREWYSKQWVEQDVVDAVNEVLNAYDQGVCSD